jgi:hypothetical protein
MPFGNETTKPPLPSGLGSALYPSGSAATMMANASAVTMGANPNQALSEVNQL